MIGAHERVFTDNRTITEEVSCRHHWIIAPPNGPTSLGICKNCGTWGDFPNSTDSALADNPKTLGLPIYERPLSLEILASKIHSTKGEREDFDG